MKSGMVSQCDEASSVLFTPVIRSGTVFGGSDGGVYSTGIDICVGLC